MFTTHGKSWDHIITKKHDKEKLIRKNPIRHNYFMNTKDVKIRPLNNTKVSEYM